ncbi:MAG: hypothetical protein ACOC71_04605 [Hyphomicrobiales bacterium]
MIAQALNASAFGTWPRAEHVAVALKAVTDDPDAAGLAPGCQRMDGAFEAVERVFLTALLDQQRLVVVVSADFAPGHASSDFV